MYVKQRRERWNTLTHFCRGNMTHDLSCRTDKTYGHINKCYHPAMLDKAMTTTETESIAPSSLKITGHRSAPKAAEDINVTQPNRALIKTENNVYENDETARGDLHATSAFGDARKLKRREHIQFAALCFSLFFTGYNDGMSSLVLILVDLRSYICDSHNGTLASRHPASLSRRFPSQVSMAFMRPVLCCRSTSLLCPYFSCPTVS